MTNKTDTQTTAANIVKVVVEGIQEKKGHRIVVADLSSIKDSICNYFVICQGGSANQVEAIAGSISDMMRDKLGEKALGVSGLENGYWIAMDYGDVIVHVLQPQAREFYDLEHLWADARLREIADAD